VIANAGHVGKTEQPEKLDERVRRLCPSNQYQATSKIVHLGDARESHLLDTKYA